MNVEVCVISEGIMGVPLLEKSVKILKTHIAKFAMQTPSTQNVQILSFR